jgi:hypothetical protein
MMAGKRDGPVPAMFDAAPMPMLASDPDQLSQPGLELLGVAHRGCADLARQRLEARQVKLPDDSPSSSPMREPASCRHCTGHPRLADAPSASNSQPGPSRRH